MSDYDEYKKAEKILYKLKNSLKKKRNELIQKSTDNPYLEVVIDGYNDILDEFTNQIYSQYNALQQLYDNLADMHARIGLQVSADEDNGFPEKLRMIEYDMQNIMYEMNEIGKKLSNP